MSRRSGWLRRALLLLMPVLLLAGCSDAQVVNALVPRGDYRLVSDVAYGDLPRQKLDLYLPLHAAPAAPVVVFLYGGNWDSGDKATYRFIGQALASRGYVTIIPDYRVYPEVLYPTFLADCAQAVQWAFAHVALYGGDPDKINLMGHSAGAYNAAMLTLDPEWLGAERMKIRSMVGLAGPYDFLPLTDPELKTIFGTAKDLALTQPITYADRPAPPIFLAAGKDDTTVLPRNSQHLAARLRAAGDSVEEHYYDAIGHVTLIGAMAAPLHFLAPVLADTMSFLATHN